MDIRFRFIKLSDANMNNTISGFALCYNTLSESNVMFETLIKTYEETKIYEKTVVKFFSCNDNTFRLAFTINGNESFQANINQIDKRYVYYLKEAMEKQGTIFIISAKSAEEDEFTINKGKYICVTRIYIDDNVIERSSSNSKFDFELLKEYIF